MTLFSKTTRLWNRQHLLWLFLSIALFTRLAFVYLHPPEAYISSDMADYHNLAQKLAETGKEDISAAFQPPGTQYLLAAFYALNLPTWSIGLFLALLSTTMCYLSFLTVKMLFGSQLALTTLAILSVNFLYIKYTGYYLAETPFSFGIALSIYLLISAIYETNSKKKNVLAFAFGFAIICTAAFKSNILLILPIIGIWWLFNFKKFKLQWSPVFVILGFLPIAIFLVWRINHLTGHHTLSISGNSGMNFYYGRAHLNYMGFLDENGNLVEGWQSPVAAQKAGWHKKEYFREHHTHNHFFMKEAWKLVKRSPMTQLKYSIGYMGDLFFTTTPWPTGNDASSRVTELFNTFICLFLVIPGMLFGLFLKSMWKQPAFVIWLSAMSIFAVAFLFFGSPRFRIPYDQLFIPLALCVYSFAYSWLTSLKANKRETRLRPDTAPISK